MMELRCSREIADRFELIEPGNATEHRSLRDAGHLRVRDCETGRARFWPWQPGVNETTVARSSS